MRCKAKVLIGGPIRQSPPVLKRFLQSLETLNKSSLIVDYYFIDDNDNIESKKLLLQFSKIAGSSVLIEESNAKDVYIKNENTHLWDDNLVWKVASFKNKIIKRCIDEGYDYLLLIDSDLILAPPTLEHLVSVGKHIISEVFWTKWQSNTESMPQVWLYDQYSFSEKGSDMDSNTKYYEFVDKLRVPGVYKVGGLGACTLIDKEALEKGVNFERIYNISFWGEDRHFSIRAAALGFELYVDTSYPAFHIYRDEYLHKVDDYLNTYKNTSMLPSLLLHKDLFAMEFLNHFFTYDYSTKPYLSGINLLSKEYEKKINKKRQEIMKYLFENKIRCKIEDFSLVDIKENSDSSVISSVFSFISEKNGLAAEKEVHCSITLRKDYETLWKVYKIVLMAPNEDIIFGFNVMDLLEFRLRVSKKSDNKVTLAMLVRNEAGKFLRPVLNHLAQYIDNAVIIDDGSEDNSVEICNSELKDIPLKLIINEQSKFSNEILLRKQLWQATIETNPDWILCLDADEMFEDAIKDVIKLLVNDPNMDGYAFRLYDFWNENQYREDACWQSHNRFKFFLIRYQPNFKYEWWETPVHCGRFPSNIYDLPYCGCNVRLKHFGWSTEDLRKSKFERYMKSDPVGRYGELEQYMSILDENPNLITWE